MDRSRQLVGAAVAVLADRGARALTHRAVDAAAGLPAGSTSNVFRTRSALVSAVVTHLLVDDVDRLTAPLARQVEGRPPLTTPGAFLAEWAAGCGQREVLARHALLADPDADALREGRAELVRIGAEHVGPAFGLVLEERVVSMAVALVDGVLVEAAVNGREIDRPLLAAALDALVVAATARRQG